ncbi:pseudouridine synthase [Lentisphaera marina]|uniref:pseudouridine synthase n=1 Tax=Lentisphaera marina TaxID=1111041 RepID=UPI0023670617|nr:pseudouridine synthase [Lentisphaera marina]MDD7984544.1 pseudouridine synthase [Lentisphaera marina]
MSGPQHVKFLYEDEYLVVAKKVAKLSVHRSEMCRDRRTLQSMVRNKLGGQYVYAVHRLDRPVSGPVLFAKSPEMCRDLQVQFTEKTVEKKYIALVRGWLEGEGEVDKQLVKKSNGAIQDCLTRYRGLATAEIDEPLGKFDTVRYGLVELEPVTGRFHQLRRHMRDLAYPIIGDSTDGDSHQNRFFRERFDLRRLMLHCFYLAFRHPVNNNLIKVYLEPDKELRYIYNELGMYDQYKHLEKEYSCEV